MVALIHELFLHRLGPAIDRVVVAFAFVLCLFGHGCGWEKGERAVCAEELDAVALRGSAVERGRHAHAKVAVVEERVEGIGDLAPIPPEQDSAAGDHASWHFSAHQKVDGGNEVDEKVGGDAARIVPILAIAEDALGTVGHFGGRAEPFRPIEIDAFLQVERNGIVPCARGAVAIVSGGNLGDFAELAGSDDLAGLLVLVGRDPLAASLDDALVAPRRFNYFGAVFNLMGHGLFDVDVFAGAERVEHDGQVPIIGRGDDDGVNVFAVEQLFVLSEVGVDFAVGALLGAREVALVTIADLDQVVLSGFFGGFEQNVAANSETDEAQVDAVAGAGGLRQRRGWKIEPIAVEHKAEASGAGGALEHEVAAGGFWHWWSPQVSPSSDRIL